MHYLRQQKEENNLLINYFIDNQELCAIMSEVAKTKEQRSELFSNRN